jgi:PAS domain S-box-containing protein
LDLSLFALGGPFANYSGPAIVIGPNRLVLAANAAADELSQIVKTAPSEELRTAIDAALSGRAAQVNPLLLPCPDDGKGQRRALDLSVLPWGDGAAALLLGRDITLDRHLRRALVDSHERYKDIVGLLSRDFAWETDAEGRFVFVSPRGGLGYSADGLLHRRAAECVVDGPVERVFQAAEAVHELRLRLRRADGSLAAVVASAKPVRDIDGVWRGARGICRDAGGSDNAPGDAPPRG